MRFISGTKMLTIYQQLKASAPLRPQGAEPLKYENKGQVASFVTNHFSNIYLFPQDHLFVLALYLETQ